MVSRVETPKNLVSKWIKAENAATYDEIIMGQMLKAEHFPNGDPLRVLRRLSYMLDMRRNPCHREPQRDRRADWLILPSGLVMKYKGRRHVRYFIDADETETNSFIFLEVARLAKKGSEFRFVVDSSFKPGSAPTSFQTAVLRNLQNGNPDWISIEPKLIRRLSLLLDDFKPAYALDENQFYIRKLTPDDEREALLLFHKFYPSNSFRPESIERYNTHYGAFHKSRSNKDKLVSVLGVVGEYNVELERNSFHVVIPGDAVTHGEFQGIGLSPRVFTSVIEDIYRRSPDAVLVADVNQGALKMCRKIGFKGGQDKDKFYWYAFDVKGKTGRGED